ncbi:unnamed protein product, partial [Aphanomyces euteiches]
PAPGDPAPGDPAPGDPAPGDPAFGDPAPGDPAFGDPAPGDPAPGDPAPGDGQPAVADFSGGLRTPSTSSYTSSPQEVTNHKNNREHSRRLVGGVSSGEGPVDRQSIIARSYFLPTEANNDTLLGEE